MWSLDRCSVAAASGSSYKRPTVPDTRIFCRRSFLRTSTPFAFTLALLQTVTAMTATAALKSSAMERYRASHTPKMQVMVEPVTDVSPTPAPTAHSLDAILEQTANSTAATREGTVSIPAAISVAHGSSQTAKVAANPVARTVTNNSIQKVALHLKYVPSKPQVPSTSEILTATRKGDRTPMFELYNDSDAGLAPPAYQGAFAAPIFDRDLFDTLAYARKGGPHAWLPPGASQDDGLQVGLKRMLASAPNMDWYFLAVVLALLVVMDLVVLQQLPETARTHVILLFFWILVAVACCMEVWLRLGPQAGLGWLTGYLLEVVFSIDNVFVFHLTFCTFETPRRLTAKAMFMGLIGSILFRFVFFFGLASMLDRLVVIPYILGTCLMYSGMKQVTSRDDELVDVTQTAPVRGFRNLLGERLGEFYDEEKEAMLAVSGKKLRITLLGVVVACLLFANFALAVDVTLTKAELFPNAYLNFFSSAIAMFAIRALFFVARDVFNRFTFAKYGVGLVLVFAGAEMLLARAVYVNALMSVAVTVLITTVSVGVSSCKDTGSKPPA